MDSSDLQTTNSNKAMPSDIVDNSSMMTPSKRDIFLSTYNRQRFSLPNSIMHYIAKNPKNSKIYLKMVKSGKYFFIKNPFLVLFHLRYDFNEWKTYYNKIFKSIDINRIKTKLWITDELNVYPGNINNNSIASSIIPKIYQCDLKRLLIRNQIISFREFMILCSSVEDLSLHRVTVKNNDGTVVSIEKIVEQLPQLQKINYNFTNPSNNTSINIWKELWKISHLPNCDRFYFENIPEDFDIESFYSFMKTNKKTAVWLFFSAVISEESETRLEAIIDEIIATKNHEYKSPRIIFPGLRQEKSFKLYTICRG